jgi:hypothetical protein
MRIDWLTSLEALLFSCCSWLQVSQGSFCLFSELRAQHLTLILGTKVLFTVSVSKQFWSSFDQFLFVGLELTSPFSLRHLVGSLWTTHTSKCPLQMSSYPLQTFLSPSRCTLSADQSLLFCHRCSSDIEESVGRSLWTPSLSHFVVCEWCTRELLVLLRVHFLNGLPQTKLHFKRLVPRQAQFSLLFRASKQCCLMRQKC